MSVISRITLILLLSMTQAAIAAEPGQADETAGSTPASEGMPLVYPAWSERPVYSNQVPPPPPGPYMSTALTDSAKGFDCCDENEPVMNRDRQQSPFFKNMEWPKRSYMPPEKWVPRSGEYQYAPRQMPPGSAPVQQQGPYYQQGVPWMPIRQPPPYSYR